MCGICGVAALEGPLPPAVAEALPAMTQTLRHRGPDGEGFLFEDRVALGHRRLAIIDRTGGGQPMANEDDTCWVIFNGEIYNHRRLRRELTARGHLFRTDSDTEAILHAYEEFGPPCVERLEGMFAFAVYDRRQQVLFLARDRLGEKPLYYAVLLGVLHFASEIKAFFPSPLWDDSVDLSRLEGYLSLGYSIAPYTTFRHVRQLEPGHWLRLADGRIEIRQYWDVTHFDDDHRPQPELLHHLATTLRSAVEARLESEVPLGAFLSGGIDSGLVVSFMAEALSAPVVTTTVGFADAAYNELEAGGQTAARYGTQHHAALLDQQLDEVLDAIMAAFDEPFADVSAVPTFYVSQHARRHVTVALSGDGGDETFAGYSFRYAPHVVEEWIRRVVPGGTLGAAGRWLGGRWPRRVPRPFRLATIVENLGGDPAAAYYADLCFLKPPLARRLLGHAQTHDPADSSVFEAVAAPYRRCPSQSALTRAQYADLKIYLPNDVLVKVDRMSMLHSLEVRCPFLDHHVVEAAFRIPAARKMPHLKAKHLLRQMARTRLPAAVWRLPKHGFTAPVARWLRQSQARLFEADVLGPGSTVQHLLDRAVVRALFDEHRAGLADHSYALWAVWMLEHWGRAMKARRTTRVIAELPLTLWARERDRRRGRA